MSWDSITIKKYVSRIEENDPTLTEIVIQHRQFTNQDIAPLMDALARNTVAARRIRKLDLSYSKLTSLDLAHLTELTELELHYNEISELDVFMLSQLTALGISDNRLVSIDVTT